MPRSKASRLKVYLTHIGLDDWAVAAPNQKAALAAWDVREDLFANGTASVTNDPKAVSAALKHPGVPVSLTDRSSLRGPSSPTRKGAKPRPAPAQKPVKAKPRDRSELDAAEAELEALGREQKAALADLEKRRRQVEAEIEDAKESFAQRRRHMEKRRDAARRAYERQS